MMIMVIVIIIMMAQLMVNMVGKLISELKQLLAIRLLCKMSQILSIYAIHIT